MSNHQQPEAKYKCTLLKEVNQCPFYIEDDSLCLKPDSEDGDNAVVNNCAFKQPLNVKPRDPYVRKPRWHEEFYENKQKARKQRKQSEQSDNGKDPFPFT